MSQSLPFLDLGQLQHAQERETEDSDLDSSCSSVSSENSNNQSSVASPVSEKKDRCNLKRKYDMYSDSSDSEDEESDIEKLLALRAEELAIAKSLGTAFRFLEKSAEANHYTTKKIQFVQDAIKNPMQFPCVRNRVNAVHKYSKSFRDKMVNATHGALSVAKDSYAGYTVEDNGKGVRTITKIDALEKEIAELKEMMKAMAAMKKEAPCSNLQGNGVDSSEVERPLTITTPAAETKMNPSIKSAIVTPMRSKGADPIRAAMLSGIKDKPQLKKVEGRRSCGGTPALAHTGAVSSHQRRPGSFNASMLAKVLDQKFKHTHASTSEDDSDSSDDSEFGSSAEDSGFESEAEEAPAKVKRVPVQTIRRPNTAEVAVDAIPLAKRPAPPFLESIKMLNNAPEQKEASIACAKSTSQGAFLEGIKGFNKNVLKKATRAERQLPSPHASGKGLLLGSIKNFQKNTMKKIPVIEQKPGENKGVQKNLLDSIRSFKPSNLNRVLTPVATPSVPASPKKSLLESIKSFQKAKLTPTKQAKKQLQKQQCAPSLPSPSLASAILVQKSLLKKSKLRKASTVKTNDENDATTKNSFQSELSKVQLRKTPMLSSRKKEIAYV